MASKRQVYYFQTFLRDTLSPYLHSKVQSFKAGHLSQYIAAWMEVTSNLHILGAITGDRIDFTSCLPEHLSYSPNFISKTHAELVSVEIHSLLQKCVLVASEHEPDEFITPLFTLPKDDTSVCFILNLKGLNAYIKYSHFTMETIYSILNLVTPNCWMASLDLKDAYYSVKIHPMYQNYLKFQYKGQLFKYTTYANGLSSCPRQFTKILKPPLSKLRCMGHIVSAYITDLYLQSDSIVGCISTIVDTAILFDSLGFVIHPDKSEFLPTQQLQYLGFIIDSVKMRVYLTDKRKQKLLLHINELLHGSQHAVIRYVAKTIGYIVPSFPAVQFGPLFYRRLEKEKSIALKLNKGDYTASMSLTRKAKYELSWWSPAHKSYSIF